MSRLCRRLLTMHVALAPTVRLFSLLGFAISQTRCKPMLLMPSTAIISGRATPLILAPLPALPPLPELIQVCVFFTLLSLSPPLIALLFPPPPPHTNYFFCSSYVFACFIRHCFFPLFDGFIRGFLFYNQKFQGNSFIYLIFLFFEILMFLCFQAMDLVFIHHLQGIYFLPPLLFIFLKTSSCCFSQSCSNAFFFIYIYIYVLSINRTQWRFYYYENYSYYILKIVKYLVLELLFKIAHMA